MLQTAHAAVAAALLWIYWAKLMRDLHTCVSSALCGASFYTAKTHAKNPFFMGWLLQQHCDGSGADWVPLVIPEEQRVKENEERKEMSAAKGFCSPCHLQQLPALGGACLWAGTAGLCKRGELCQVLSPDTSQTTRMALDLRERSSRATRESWPSWQGNSSLAAGSWAVSTARVLRKEPFSAEGWALLAHLPSK